MQFYPLLTLQPPLTVMEPPQSATARCGHGDAIQQ